MTPAQLGAQLRRAGLTEHALLAWAGTPRLSALAPHLPAVIARPPTPAATALAVFAGGVELAIDRARALPIDALLAEELVERAGDRIRATVAILPLEQTLVVCDRLDAPASEDLVCWPDDSSYHLAGALAPRRRTCWYDLATGSAFAPLARPALAATTIGIELNPRAARFARLGLALSGCADRTRIVEADIADGAPATRGELVTCNAPIPDDDSPAIWRRTDRAFFTRLWTRAREYLAAGGDIVVHCTLDAVPDGLAGEVVTVVYTPPGERAYAVTWWAPDRPARAIRAARALTSARPHVDPRDREDALRGALPAG